jgi:hypothetical protein
MTENNITPPPELVREWQREANHNEAMFPQVAAQAAQWGSDQELEACCAFVRRGPWCSEKLRAARRPQTLKQQAIAVLDDAKLDSAHYNILLRALEQLDD